MEANNIFSAACKATGRPSRIDHHEPNMESRANVDLCAQYSRLEHLLIMEE